MSLIAEIKTQLEDAMREGDAARRDTLRLILASLQGAEKELQRPLSRGRGAAGAPARAEEAARGGGGVSHRAAARSRPTRKRTSSTCSRSSCPSRSSEDELEAIVDDVIAEVGATSMRDIGRVMADVMPQVAGRADGSAVSQLVREKLA